MERSVEGVRSGARGSGAAPTSAAQTAPPAAPRRVLAPGAGPLMERHLFGIRLARTLRSGCTIIMYS